MAQQDTTPKAVAQAGTDRTHFLIGINTLEYKCSSPAMGFRDVETSVCVFSGATDQPVMLVMRSGAFSLHNTLSAEEARTLAAALLLAADHTEAADQEAALAALQQAFAAGVPERTEEEVAA